MRSKKLAILVVLGSFLLSSCALMEGGSTDSTPIGAMSGQGQTVSPEILVKYTAGWPDSSVQAAKSLLSKYGQPTESTPSMLIWKGVTPFKRIIVYREEITHKFPMLHKDVVEHVVSYKVPIEKVEALSRFDGSIIVDRTRGELASRGGDEAMNILALNLANDVVTGRRDATSARTELGRLAVDLLNGNKGALTENLQFVAQSNSADPDQSTKFNWAQAQEDQPVQKQEGKKSGLLRQAQEEIAE
jgi:hypothetical protein